MSILQRMNLRPLPVFDKEGEGAGGAGGDGDAAAAAAAAALAAKGKTGNAMGGDGEGDQGGGGAKDMPENWRDFFAGDDDTLKSEFGRVKTPADLGKRFKDMREKLSKGAKLLEDAPDGAKEPDKLKAWREERGIPAESTGYTVPDAVKTKITDADKPIVDGFLEYMHKRNATPREVANGLEYYYGLQEATAADRATVDSEHETETLAALKGEWGVDYKRNLSIMRRAGKEFGGVDWFNARLPDGRLLGNVPGIGQAMFEWGEKNLSDLDLEESAGGGGGGAGGIDGEIGALEGEMKKDMKAWRRAPEKGQRLQELYAKRDQKAARTR